MPAIQPSPGELQEMAHRAATVVRLLEELKRFGPEGRAAKENLSQSLAAVEEQSRPPKRPWEDMSRDENGTPAPDASYSEVCSYSRTSLFSSLSVLVFFQAPPQYPQDIKAQSTAEQDMEIIRSKRASSTGGNAPGQPKSKYRKRSVSGFMTSFSRPHLGLTRKAARYPSGQMSLVQYSRDPGMEAGPGWSQNPL